MLEVMLEINHTSVLTVINHPAVLIPTQKNCAQISCISYQRFMVIHWCKINHKSVFFNVFIVNRVGLSALLKKMKIKIHI